MKRTYETPEIKVRVITEDSALMQFSGGAKGNITVDETNEITDPTKIGAKVNKAILWDDEEE